VSSACFSAPCSLQEALLRAATEYTNRGIGVVDSRGRETEYRTYREFYDAARAAAARFVALGVKPGEPVMVALPTSWSWLECWFGIMLCGGLPTAIAAAGALATDEVHLAKIDAVIAKLGARYLVSRESLRERAAELGYSHLARSALLLDELEATPPATRLEIARPQPEDLAFLQLTSGSTGLPRAVMISHQAAVHNPMASNVVIGAPFGCLASEWADAMAAWLPLYHDMGLIGCLMLPILSGLDTFLLRPEAFLARPHLWLTELTRHGATFAPAPNFAYQQCVERVKASQLDGVDLSVWRGAMTGAETIRPETVSAFCERFAQNGFSPTSFRPCYGLAEGTLTVTMDQRGVGARTLPIADKAVPGIDLNEVVSTGGPIPDTTVRIIAPDGSTCADGTIGEVWVEGPSVFSGYYNDEAATATSLRDGWLVTGDLGFLAEGELYLTGRTKDVLIIHGHNMMPDDLERIADGVSGGGGMMRSAAFSISHGVQGEQAVLAVEVVERDPALLARLGHDIKVKIGRALSLPLADLVFVRRGKLPRTSSGKVQRTKVRQLYLDNELERITTD